MLCIQSNFAAWNNLMQSAKNVVAEQPCVTHDPVAQKQCKPLLRNNESVAGKQRFTVERKTGVKTIQKRRRGGGYVDNSRAWELVNFYGALRGEALSSEEAAGFSHSAKALLDACSNNLQEAKACLTESLTKPGTRRFVPSCTPGRTEASPWLLR
jgi:hypothetical protein